MSLKQEYQRAQDKINSKLATLKKMRATCERQKRLPSKDERDSAEKLLAEIDALEARQKEIEKNGGSDPPDKPNPGDPGENRDLDHNTARARTGQDISYRNLFGSSNLSTDGFDNFGQWLSLVASNRHSDKLVTRTQNIALGSEGGFLCPDSYAASIVDLALSKSLLWKKATTYPISTNTLKVPAVSDTDHSSSRAGLVALWKAEEAELSLDSIDLRQLEFNANKLTLLVKCSREFLDDAKASEQFVTSVMGSEIGYQLDRVFLNSGTGVGQPLSILNSGALITTAKESGQTAGSLLWENITAMSNSFNPGAGDDGIWIFSPSLKNQVYKMSQAIGTGGTSIHPDPSQVNERGLNLLGFPVRFSELCNLAGEKGDAFLISPKSYAIALRHDLRIESSSHTYFTSDSVVFRATIRVDGMPIAAEPLTLSDGTTQVSDFITLAAR